MRLALVFLVLTAAKGTAQETCVEPLRPDAGYLVDAGNEAWEMREAYRGYFSEVENYLNCLNHASARIRREATAAAQDYSRVLDQYPVQSGQGGEPPQTPRIEMGESGTLFLDYEPKWLQ